MNGDLENLISNSTNRICEDRMTELAIHKNNYEIFSRKLRTSIYLMVRHRKMGSLIKQIDKFLADRLSIPVLSRFAAYVVLKSFKFRFDEIVRNTFNLENEAYKEFIQKSHTAFTIVAFNELYKRKMFTGSWWLSYRDWYLINNKMIVSFGIDVLKYLNSEKFGLDLKTAEKHFEYEIIRRKLGYRR